MSLSDSRLSYEDCYKVMDKALDSSHGVRVGYINYEEASYFRMRMNKARSLDRRFNGERYTVGQPLHKRSEYDMLTFRVRFNEDMWWVYAERKSMSGVVEEIEEDHRIETKKPIREVLTFRRF